MTWTTLTHKASPSADQATEAHRAAKLASGGQAIPYEWIRAAAPVIGEHAAAEQEERFGPEILQGLFGSD